MHLHDTSSARRMYAVRSTRVPAGSLALWFLGQNGFLLKGHTGPLIAIDPYLTDSCAAKYKHLGLDLTRRMPVLIEPEDFDVEYVVLTHSHDDHLDDETIRRLRCAPHFVAPWQAAERLLQLGIAASRVTLLHPKQSVDLGGIRLEGTFALPTDGTDLNHIGVLFTTEDGIRFYNTGDTAHAESLKDLLPTGVDLCAICINGGFHNLDAEQAAQLVEAVAPSVVIPTHYDMMLSTTDAPTLFRAALARTAFRGVFKQMGYDHHFLYTRSAP